MGLAGALGAANQQAGALHSQGGAAGPAEGSSTAARGAAVQALVVSCGAKAGRGVAAAAKAGA